jgi:hypothetical protein
MSPGASPEIELYLALIDEAYDHPAWHGPNLRGALRGLSAAEAAWRPAPARHSVWEIALHAAYWKYAVRRRIVGGLKRGGFARRPSNWPRMADPPSESVWKDDLALLDEEHRLLREVIEAFPAGMLARRIAGTKHTYGRLIGGIAAHDFYHAGQVRQLIALQGAKRKTR